MADSQTVIQLKAKQAELQDVIVYLEGKLQEARNDLIHVNAVLRLFEIGSDPKLQFPAHINLSRMFGQGELMALALASLKTRGGEVTTREIAADVVKAKGWDESDRVLRSSVAHRLVHALTKARTRRTVRSPGYLLGVRVWCLP